MGLEICGKCGRFHYVPGPCPPKLERGKPKAVEPDDISKPPLRSNTDPIHPIEAIAAHALIENGNALLGVLKRGVGRPKTIDDMKAYKAQKQREYRARKKG